MPVSQGQPGNCPRATGVVSGNSAGAIACPNVTLTGSYAQASDFLTGESRNYNPAIARFERVTPRSNLGQAGGWGAFELTGRISNLNFDDGSQFQKGEETDYTLGLNWYLNPNIRLMANYIWVRNNVTAVGDCTNALSATTATCTNTTVNGAGDDNPRLITVRAQGGFPDRDFLSSAPP
ncbi:MAG: porin [Alphaproteobacteria bacterium]